MPQPTSKSARAGGPARKPAPAKRDGRPPSLDPGGVLDVLTRGIVLTAERIQEAMDDAVRRGRMTRDDAEELMQSLVSAGRRQTEELVHDVEQLVGRSREAAGDARRRARRAAGLRDSFPIARYDELTAAQITSRLGELRAGDLRKVRDYERRHGNRKSVLAAVERALG